jgi:hypothetical protein
VQLGITERGGGTGGESLEQLAIAVIEDAVSRQLIGYLDRADRDAARDHGRSHHRHGQHLSGVEARLVPGVFGCPGDYRGPGSLGHITDETGAHRHASSHQLLGCASGREPTTQQVALCDPDRSSLSSEHGEHPFKYLGQ